MNAVGHSCVDTKDRYKPSDRCTTIVRRSCKLEILRWTLRRPTSVSQTYEVLRLNAIISCDEWGLAAKCFVACCNNKSNGIILHGWYKTGIRLIVSGKKHWDANHKVVKLREGAYNVSTPIYVWLGHYKRGHCWTANVADVRPGISAPSALWLLTFIRDQNIVYLELEVLSSVRNRRIFSWNKCNYL